MLPGEHGIGAVLDRGYGESVADRKAPEVDQALEETVGGALEQLVGHGRDIVTGIALARDEQRSVLQLRSLPEQGHEKVLHVLRHARLVVATVRVILREAEPRVDRLVDEDHRGGSIPTKLRLVDDNFPVLIAAQRVGPVLVEDGEFGRTARPSRHPQDHGRVVGGVAALEQKEEHLGRVRPVESKVAREAFGFRGVGVVWVLIVVGNATE